MAKLIYSMLMSLDGYVADSEGHFDWAAPDEQVHSFVNELERPLGTHLYGRRMYDVMSVWETLPTEGEPDCIADYAKIWKAADKIVYSTTLKTVSTGKTQLEQSFEPESVRRMKASAQRDLSISGPALAAHAFRAGLIDECQLFLAPIIVGGGKPALPNQVRLQLELLDERRFDHGMVFLRYQVLT